MVKSLHALCREIQCNNAIFLKIWNRIVMKQDKKNSWLSFTLFIFRSTLTQHVSNTFFLLFYNYPIVYSRYCVYNIYIYIYIYICVCFELNVIIWVYLDFLPSIRITEKFSFVARIKLIAKDRKINKVKLN